MSTGLETWNTNLLDIGPLYPFVGTEMLLTIIGIASWIIWHLIQLRMESKIYAEEDALLSDPAKLKAAMDMSNAETLAETLKAHAPKLGG